MTKIVDIKAFEILDSRGNPTIEVDVTLAGGVSANSLLRKRMREEAEKHQYRLFYPRLEYCMDNAAMIAYVGWMKLREGIKSDFELHAVANLSLQSHPG